jgi:hypothetical protein
VEVSWEDDGDFELGEFLTVVAGEPVNANIDGKRTYGFDILNDFDFADWQKKAAINLFLGKALKNKIFPGSGDWQADVTYRWFGVDGPIDEGTAYFDGNKNGLLDFLDLNQNGIQDPNEPSEPVATTDLEGAFELLIPVGFDVDEDGMISAAEGQLAIVGGTDTSRNGTLAFPLVAPVGSAVVSPLTTLITSLVDDHGYTVANAEARVRQAFSLPDLDLTHTNPIKGSTDGDPAAATIFAAGAKLHNTYTQIASFTGNLPEAPPASFMADVFMRDLAAKIAMPGSAMNLSHPKVVLTLIESVMTEAGMVVDPTDTAQQELLSGAADVIAAGNQYIDALAISANVDFLTDVARAQVVAQGDAADQLAGAASGDIDIATVMQEFMDHSDTDHPLTDRIEAAETGIVRTPRLFLHNGSLVEGNSGATMMEFTVTIDFAPVSPVRVEWATAAALQAVAGVDFETGSGALTWDIGDTAPKTIQVPILGDTEFELDEDFLVLLFNPSGAVVEGDLGFGTILNDDVFHYSAPVGEPENNLLLQLHETGYNLFNNDGLEESHDFGGPVPVVITGSATDSNHLTVAWVSDSNALQGGLHFAGGEMTDTLAIQAGTAIQVEHHVESTTSGMVMIDGTMISYEGVEELIQEVVPVILDVPALIHEADTVTVRARGPSVELQESYTFAWTWRQGDAVLSSGDQDSFSFTPSQDGVYTLTLTASIEGRAPATTIQTIRVANAAPTARAESYTTDEDTTLSVQASSGLLINDTDPGPDPLSAVLVSGPAHAQSFTLNADGSFVYEPALNYSGPDSFRYLTSDGDLVSGVVTVSLTVVPVADAPSVSGSGAGAETAAIPLSIITTLADTDGSEAISSYQIRGLPAGAMLSRGTLHNGVWTLTPTDAASVTATFVDNGLFTLTVRATSRESANGVTASAEGPLTVTVANVRPDFEAGPNATLFPMVRGAFSRNFAFTDPGADTWSGTVNFGDGSGERPLTINQVTKSFAINHNYLASGRYTVTITVRDDDGGQHIDSFQVHAILAIVQFAQAAFVDMEKDGVSTVVTLTRDTDAVFSQVAVSITGGSAVGGADYVSGTFPMTVSFHPGETTKAVPITLRQEVLVERDETIDFVVAPVLNVKLGPQVTATFTIRNEDLPVLPVVGLNPNPSASLPEYTVDHLALPVQVPLSAPGLSGPVWFTARALSELNNLQSQYGFQVHFQGLFENWSGRGEKWLISTRLGGWYYLTPDGMLWRWGNGISRDTVVWSLPRSVHTYPQLLYQADSNQKSVTAQVTGAAVTIAAEPGFVGRVLVEVTASNGSQSSTGLFLVNVRNGHAPVLNHIPDRVISRSTRTLEIDLGVSDGDGDPLTLRAQAHTHESLLNEQHRFYVDPRGLFENWAGLRERWLRSGSTGDWYYLLPDGQLYYWTPSTTRWIATLSPRVHADPRLLYDAVSEQAPATVAVQDQRLIVTPSPNFAGSFPVQVSVTDGSAVTTQTFLVVILNRAPQLVPVEDQFSSSGSGARVLSLAVNDQDNDPLTITAQVTSQEYLLDQQFDFFVDPRGFFENAFGQGEKWLRSSTLGEWFYIRPDGQLYRWGRGVVADTWIATLDRRTHADPTRLVNVQNGISPVTASVLGRQLTITPEAGFVGSVTILLTVSDGAESASDWFTFTVF